MRSCSQSCGYLAEPGSTVCCKRCEQGKDHGKHCAHRSDQGIQTSILSCGSSQAEVLDYVFHGDTRYVTHDEDDRVGFFGGASCRGLKKERNRRKVVSAVSDQLARTDVDNVAVFLVYGGVDVEWTVPSKFSIQLTTLTLTLQP